VPGAPAAAAGRPGRSERRRGAPRTHEDALAGLGALLRLAELRDLALQALELLLQRRLARLRRLLLGALVGGGAAQLGRPRLQLLLQLLRLLLRALQLGHLPLQLLRLLLHPPVELGTALGRVPLLLLPLLRRLRARLPQRSGLRRRQRGQAAAAAEPPRPPATPASRHSQALALASPAQRTAARHLLRAAQPARRWRGCPAYL
jgi:hypothetical protein